MEKFRNKIQMKLRIISLMCCFNAALSAAFRFIADNTSDFASGLITGFRAGLLVVCIFYIAKFSAMLNDDEKLKKAYVEETDERNVALMKETSNTAGFISLLVTAFAVVVSSFFSKAVCLTLAAALLADAVITIIVKGYYNKRM